jgi:hypothetical protein
VTGGGLFHALPSTIREESFKMKKPKKPTNPNKLPLCIMIAGEDHLAGVLLERIMWWWPYASISIPKKPGEWIANSHVFWMREARMSPDQFSRTLRRLVAKGLVERTQFWFAGLNILHVRPTLKTIEFLQAAKTWPAANELMVGQNASSQTGKFAEPDSANSLNPNGSSKNAESGSAKSPDSNYIKTNHKMEHEIFSSGSPAMPINPGKGKNSPQNFVSGPEEVGVFQELPDVATTSAMSLTGATNIWINAVKLHFPSNPGPKLSPQQKGAMALITQGLGQFWNGEDVSFQADTVDIFHFGIKHWSKWKTKKPQPDPEIFCEFLGEIVNDWVGSGRPKVQTN